MDHCFLKEPASEIRTAWHQDAPYFPFTGEQVAVCWVPVDPVCFQSGAMGYVKGSHKWPEHSPNTLYSNEKTHESGNKLLPDIDANNEFYDIVYFDAMPGDVIIHHPLTVHGSRGNITSGTNATRRLAASIRYCGDDVRWLRKKSELSTTTLAKKWHLQKDMTLLRSSALFFASSLLEYCWRRITRSVLPAGYFPQDYEQSIYWCYNEMKNGETLNERDCSRCAFPQVWPNATRKSKL
jgi:ectoine hydroxylase-related dioxygenase (phytanoyl-CoA dioxygenase family)